MPKLRSSDSTTGNDLLDSLPRRELAAILPHTELVALAAEQVVARPGKAFGHVHFPVDCVLSMVQRTDPGEETEVSSIGREGIASPRPLLGLDRISNPGICTLAGSSYRVSLTAFLKLAEDCLTLRKRALRYNGTLLVMYAQLSACNRFHEPLERCARWLLLAQDRTGRDIIDVTHQFLARLLGVHRPAVSLVVSTLKKRGAIASRRGAIVIRAREKLEAASCECYGKIVAEFQRLNR